MHILALNPFHTGSHAAFLEGWSQWSEHRFDVRGLSGHHWKWRMRHSAITFAQQLHAAQLHAEAGDWDLLFCTDMLNLAEFKGLAPKHLRDLPTVAYFHENQLTYPSRTAEERDLHFAFSNLTTALAADAVWFNSDYHRRTWLEALPKFLSRMPDHAPRNAVEQIADKSRVLPPGIDVKADSTVPIKPNPGPLHIAWVSRWEHDKQPELFHAALQRLRLNSVPFELSILGERFAEVPPVFEQMRNDFSDHIQHWGYAADRAEYLNILRGADVVVSTAAHEFFGIAVMEAAACGAVPVVPDDLAYRELFAGSLAFLTDGTAEETAKALAVAAQQKRQHVEEWKQRRSSLRALAEGFHWRLTAPRLDRAVREI
ncbi:tRNA-queuosine alpha-mannosyltransferase domain-containing protein [Calycomorphotria hydatis]|uniref:tRNA-queuosine alpha-mannosyltransferase n=1 Tax=Calycomorphotria hydatis TaxID=2528027 RepID=A0A517T3A4_9PLAN|nr:DUF3524 domain-containing protein [Calycomorphotria hydatis]QDT62849.1 Glycosyl transferases group 1 [Calycomorphotria hydatis]